MGVLIDASVLIDIERRGAAPDALLAITRGEPAFYSPVVVAELLYVLTRATDDAKRDRRTAFIEAVLAKGQVLPIDERDARAHATLRRTLERRGTPIGTNDLWIAVQALVRGHAVATLNVREFARVPGLRVFG